MCLIVTFREDCINTRATNIVLYFSTKTKTKNTVKTQPQVT